MSSLCFWFVYFTLDAVYKVKAVFILVLAAESNFMSQNEILEFVKQLKIKNCEGYDRMPQRFLIDGIDILINPLLQLFSLIYRDILYFIY